MIDKVRRSLALSGVILFAAGAAFAAVQAGDQLISLQAEGGKVFGPYRNDFGPVVGGALDYFYHLTDHFSLGFEGAYQKPLDRTVSLGGLDAHVKTSLAPTVALARVDLA